VTETVTASVCGPFGIPHVNRSLALAGEAPCLFKLDVLVSCELRAVLSYRDYSISRGLLSAAVSGLVRRDFFADHDKLESRDQEAAHARPLRLVHAASRLQVCFGRCA
jgi:hypothetical protein